MPIKAKPTPLTPDTTAPELLSELYLAILAALQAADRPGTHIAKTNELKVSAAILHAAMTRSARFLGHIRPPRFLRYR